MGHVKVLSEFKSKRCHCCNNWLSVFPPEYSTISRTKWCNWKVEMKPQKLSNEVTDSVSHQHCADSIDAKFPTSSGVNITTKDVFWELYGVVAPTGIMCRWASTSFKFYFYCVTPIYKNRCFCSTKVQKGSWSWTNLIIFSLAICNYFLTRWVTLLLPT